MVRDRVRVFGLVLRSKSGSIGILVKDLPSGGSRVSIFKSGGKAQPSLSVRHCNASTGGSGIFSRMFQRNDSEKIIFFERKFSFLRFFPRSASV